MVSFLTLYRGPSLAAAELIAVTTDPELVAIVAGAILRSRPPDESHRTDGDPAISAIVRGRQRALRLVRAEAEDIGVASGCVDRTCRPRGVSSQSTGPSPPSLSNGQPRTHW